MRIKVIIGLLAILTASPVSAQSVRKVYSGGTTAAGDATYAPDQEQQAIDDAQPGEIIYFENGLTFTGTIILVAKECAAQDDTCYITISGGIDSAGNVLDPATNYPLPNVRITPAYAPVLPKFRATVNNSSAFRTAYPGETGHGCTTAPCIASYWKFRWIEGIPNSPWNAGSILQIGTNKGPTDTEVPGGDHQNQQSEIPHHIILDQVYIHGDPVDGQNRCMTNAGRYTYVRNSYFQHCMSQLETQAISIVNTTGPQEYVNNYMEGSGETFLTGGADPYGRFSATVLASPAPTVVSARLSQCAEMGTTANHRWFTIEVGGVEHYRMIDTINTGTCDITWTDPLAAVPDQPGDADAVNWSWPLGGLLVEKNYMTKPLAWRDPIQATPATFTATQSTTGGTLPAATNVYRIQARRLTTNSNYAQSTMFAEQTAVTTTGTSSVALTWTAAPNADHYRIYWRVGGSAREITVNAPATSYTHTSPTDGVAVAGSVQNVTATPSNTGGTLTAGTYYYRVNTTPYIMPSTSQVSCVIPVGVTTGSCIIDWNEDTNATSYRVWGRGLTPDRYLCTAGAPCTGSYTTLQGTTIYTDIGGGAEGSGYKKSDYYFADQASVWIVKNTFELKNCDGLSEAGPCIVRGNVFENSWKQGQTGMVVNVKNNNQNFNDDSAVFRATLFENNIIRNGTRAIQTCAFDCDGHGSGVSTGIWFRNNLIYNINDTFGEWQSVIYMGAGSNAGMPSQRGGTDYEYSHNTILAQDNGYGPFLASGETDDLLWTDLKWKDNIAMRGVNGWHALWNGSFGSGGEGSQAWGLLTTGPNRVATNNVFADAPSGTYSASFLLGDYPTFATMQTYFANFATCITGTIADCAITSGAANNGASDGTDIGANIPTLMSYTDIAISGDNSGAEPPPEGSDTAVVVSSASGGITTASGLTSVTTDTTLAITGTSRYVVCSINVQSTSRNGVSVTINATGQTLTMKDFNNVDVGGLQARVEYWDIVNPTATTSTVTATINLSTATVLSCVALENVDQVTPYSNLTEAGTNSNTVSVTVPSVTEKLVLETSSVRVGTVGLTPGAGQTAIIERQSAAGVGNVTALISTKPGAASTVMTWTVDDSTSKSWSSIGVSLNGAGEGEPPPPPPATLSITSISPLDTAVVGVPYSFTFAATGGVPPYTWTRTAGIMPPGLSLSAAGVLSGTPTTSGTGQLTIRVTDSTSVTDTDNFQLKRLASRPDAINGDEARTYRSCTEPGLANDRIVWPGDFWINTCTNAINLRTAANTWLVVGSGAGSLALGELSDVSITNPDAGQALRYDVTSQKWTNIAFSGFEQGGNAFGTAAVLGTTDQQPINFIANGTVRFKTDADPLVNSGTVQANGNNNPELYVSDGDRSDWMGFGFNATDGRRVVAQAGGGTVRTYFGLAGAVNSSDFFLAAGSSVNSGATNTRWFGVRLDGMFRIKHLTLETGTRPTCNAAERGTFWYVAGGVGAKDTVEVCTKDAGDVYAWRVIY